MSSESNNLLPVLSIIIPTKNRLLILQRHLQSHLAAIDKLNIEIIIVNDDDEQLHGLPNDSRIKVVEKKGNGVASARNLGASFANSSLLLFLDDDMVIFKENINAILTFHQYHSDCFLNLNWNYPPEVLAKIQSKPFGRYLVKNGFSTLKGWNKDNKHWRDDVLFRTNGITSQNLSVSKATFNELGGYDESFPYAGFEDHEFSKRIFDRNFKIYIDPLQIMYHDESDRLKLSSWLTRKYRGGITRRVAVSKGFKEAELPAGVFKLLLVQIFSPFIKLLAQLVEKIIGPDKIFFLVVNQLLALSIYGGYYSNEANKLSRLNE